MDHTHDIDEIHARIDETLSGYRRRARLEDGDTADRRDRQSVEKSALYRSLSAQPI